MVLLYKKSLPYSRIIGLINVFFLINLRDQILTWDKSVRLNMNQEAFSCDYMLCRNYIKLKYYWSVICMLFLKKTWNVCIINYSKNWRWTKGLRLGLHLHLKVHRQLSHLPHHPPHLLRFTMQSPPSLHLTDRARAMVPAVVLLQKMVSHIIKQDELMRAPCV